MPGLVSADLIQRRLAACLQSLLGDLAEFFDRRRSDEDDLLIFDLDPDQCRTATALLNRLGLAEDARQLAERCRKLMDWSCGPKRDEMLARMVAKYPEEAEWLRGFSATIPSAEELAASARNRRVQDLLAGLGARELAAHIQQLLALLPTPAPAAIVPEPAEVEKAPLQITSGAAADGSQGPPVHVRRSTPTNGDALNDMDVEGQPASSKSSERPGNGKPAEPLTSPEVAVPAKPLVLWMSSGELTIALLLPKEKENAVDLVLRRFAAKHPDCRDPIPKPRKGESWIVYRVDDVWPHLLTKRPGWLRSSPTTD
jgi:hypothetical protein